MSDFGCTCQVVWEYACPVHATLPPKMRKYLDKVKADALREAAEALPKPVGLNCSKECHNADWLSLLRRADRIEAGNA